MSSWAWGQPLEHGRHISDHILKGSWFSLPQKPSSANSFSVLGSPELLPIPWWDGFVLCRSLCPTAAVCSWVEQPIMPRRHWFSLVLPDLWHLQFSLSLGVCVCVTIQIRHVWLRTPLTLILCPLTSCEFLISHCPCSKKVLWRHIRTASINR